MDCEEQLLVLVRADGNHQQLSITVPDHISQTLLLVYTVLAICMYLYGLKYIRDDDRLARGRGRGGA